MNKSIIAGVSTFALVAGLAAIPVATLANKDASEHRDLVQGKESNRDTVQFLKKALDEAREHGDDLNHCNNIQQALYAAEAVGDAIRADIEEDKDR